MRPIRIIEAAAALAAGIALACVGVLPAAAAPSFACSGDLIPSEAAICADPGLAALDRGLDEAFRERLDRLSPNDRASAIAAQRAWLVQRDSCGGNLFCLRNAYVVRIEQLAPGSALADLAKHPPASGGAAAGCMVLFHNLCPDLVGRPDFVGLCYNRNPQVFAHIPDSCQATFQRQLDQTIPANPAMTAANMRRLPFPGMSLGGQIRSGPGMNYARVAALVEGTRLTILSDAGLTMDGYRWFRVAWSTGSGYEWGGILCSDDAKLHGIFSVCGAP